MKKHIFKFQTGVRSDGMPMLMIYNRNRSVMQVQERPELKGQAVAQHAPEKWYSYARITKNRIIVGDEAPEQAW